VGDDHSENNHGTARSDQTPLVSIRGKAVPFSVISHPLGAYGCGISDRSAAVDSRHKNLVDHQATSGTEVRDGHESSEPISVLDRSLFAR
jgi:hypothetical protein